MSKCLCCKREQELRMGFCFDCAGAESIIDDGTDMFDNELPEKDRIPGSVAINRLRFLIVKGWKPPKN